MLRRTRAPERRRENLLLRAGVSTVDWKDTALLRMFVSDRGKIRSRPVTGLTPRQQREIAVAIKNAREMALLPYPSPSRR
ncbi:30S ribosomal protein S18 [Kibdelosporangium phytohabitans]|uniref:Small ribosomal subunit protein bS18 n=1 Tax=Kibdelosporangium phytohabitans TaxID=860235 RepID=A0A0N9HT79_9PSEU|nr:30S ribosomal protein S18 [Kibdelosporangium phytohabitans]ALG06429.1 30S ribosomal protein S18 [Kibdelosporangium phytohabitans]MBE1467591.1 small subunit ribosomal protein S18 [Kibdelosporangium phytohabitans]